MSGLPDQEPQKTYTADDVQHIVAREIAKQQLAQLQAGQIETNKKIIEMTAQFTAELKGLREMISAQPAHVESCKSDLRREIDKDFPSRLETLDMEHRIEERISAVDVKVDKQWIKITVVMGTLSAVITGLGVAMNYWLMISRVAGG